MQSGPTDRTRTKKKKHQAKKESKGGDDQQMSSGFRSGNTEETRKESKRGVVCLGVDSLYFGEPRKPLSGLEHLVLALVLVCLSWNSAPFFWLGRRGALEPSFFLFFLCVCPFETRKSKGTLDLMVTMCCIMEWKTRGPGMSTGMDGIWHMRSVRKWK